MEICLTNIIRIVWLTVTRITNLIWELELKYQKKIFRMQFQKNYTQSSPEGFSY